MAILGHLNLWRSMGNIPANRSHVDRQVRSHPQIAKTNNAVVEKLALQLAKYGTSRDLHAS